MRNAKQRTLVVCLVLMVSTVCGSIRAKAEPVKITMWYIGVQDDPIREIIQGAVDRFNAAHDNIQISAESYENQSFKSVLQASVAANEQPDIFQTWGGGALEDLVNGGLVREIPDLDSDLSEKFVPNALALSTFEGKHYAMPLDMAGIFFWYNKSIFESNNLELPTTWDKLIAACQALKANGITPIALGNKERWPGSLWYTYLAMRLGGPDIAANALHGTDGASYLDQPFLDAGDKISEAVASDCFEEGYNALYYGDTQLLMISGQVAMQLQGNWHLGTLRALDPDFTNENIRFLPFPTIDGGKDDPGDMVGGTGNAFAVSLNAPPEAETALVELFSSDDIGKALAEHGYIPALKDFDDAITDPMVQDMAKAILDAPRLQLAYDQFLPPALSEVHLNTTSQLFGLTITAEDAATQLEDTAKKFREK